MRTSTLDKSPTDDPRLENHWKWRSAADLPKASHKNSIAIVSYPDDEGVRLNNGRPGANEGPARILYFLGRMVKTSATPEIVIVGDRFTQLRVRERHDAAEATVTRCFEKGYRVLTWGGGHDYGYPDGAAFLRTFPRGKILNVDAHLDVRPVIDEKLNSGTAFSRLIEKFGGKKICAWGPQRHCNSEAQWNWAAKQKMKILNYQKPLPQMNGTVGLSICLDAFAGIRGVSAPAILGLSVEQSFDLLKKIGIRSPWLGIYECAPRYDPQNEDSARLAALLSFHFIHASQLLRA